MLSVPDQGMNEEAARKPRSAAFRGPRTRSDRFPVSGSKEPPLAPGGATLPRGAASTPYISLGSSLERRFAAMAED